MDSTFDEQYLDRFITIHIDNELHRAAVIPILPVGSAPLTSSRTATDVALPFFPPSPGQIPLINQDVPSNRKPGLRSKDVTNAQVYRAEVTSDAPAQIVPRWVSVLVGLVLSSTLGLLAYVVSVGIASDMLETCLQEIDAGDTFIVVTLLIPAVLTIAATAITYTVAHVLIEQSWSIYVAVSAAVLVTPVMVVYAINTQWSPTPTELCPTGTPSWWPWQITEPY